MVFPMIAIPIILLLLSAAIAVVAGLAWSAKLPGNNWVGIRAQEARKSKENWDITHRVAGPSWAVAAVAFLGSAALAYVATQPDTTGWMWVWVAVAALGGVGMLGVGGAMGSHTIALYDAKKTADEEAASGGGCCSSGGSTSNDADSGATGGAAAGSAGGVCGDGATCGTCGGCDTPEAEAPSGSNASTAPAVDLEAVQRAATRADGQP